MTRNVYMAVRFHDRIAIVRQTYSLQLYCQGYVGKGMAQTLLSFLNLFLHCTNAVHYWKKPKIYFCYRYVST